MLDNRTLNARNQCLKSKQTENSIIEYTVNWAAELGSDEIISNSWTSEDSGVTITDQSFVAITSSDERATSTPTTDLNSLGATSITTIGWVVGYENVILSGQSLKFSTHDTIYTASASADGAAFTEITLTSGLTEGIPASTTMLDLRGSQKQKALISGDIGRYLIVNKIVTSAGETKERYIDLTIMDNSRYYANDFWPNYYGGR